MRNILILTGILLLFSNLKVTGQEKNDLDLICSGKWHLEYLEMDEERMYLTADEQKLNWVIFYPNGKHEVMEEGESYFGKWEFLKDKRILRTKDRDGLVDHKIVMINADKFVASVIEQGGLMYVGMKKDK